MKLSYKKTLGTLGALVFFLICVVAVFKDATQAGMVLYPLAGLVTLLFGIKTAGGVAIAKINKEDHK